MAMSEQEIATRLDEALPGSEIEIIDLVGDKNHWKAVIASPAFAGKSRIQQHQMVYSIFADEIRSGELHALALETRPLES